MPQHNSLDLARLNAEAAQLHLVIGPPQKLQNPVAAPARQIPGAVHPASRRTKRVRHKTLRRQPTTAHIAPPKPQARYVKLPRNPNRHRLQTTIQYINLRVRYRTAYRQALAYLVSKIG